MSLKKPNFERICDTAIHLSSLPKRSLHGKLFIIQTKKVHDEYWGVTHLGS